MKKMVSVLLLSSIFRSESSQDRDRSRTPRMGSRVLWQELQTGSFLRG